LRCKTVFGKIATVSTAVFQVKVGYQPLPSLFFFHSAKEPFRITGTDPITHWPVIGGGQ